MKQFLIIALVCVNLALVAVLAFHVTAPPAQAQARGFNATDYVMLTSRLGNEWDSVVVIDARAQRMTAWSFNLGNKQLEPFKGRDLRADFRPSR